MRPALQVIRTTVAVGATVVAVGGVGYGGLQLAAGQQSARDRWCADHDCVSTYAEGDGQKVQCSDGVWSWSGGVQGACSYHGGIGSGESDLNTFPFGGDSSDDPSRGW